jgi:hypothetical protein
MVKILFLFCLFFLFSCHQRNKDVNAENTFVELVGSEDGGNKEKYEKRSEVYVENVSELVPEDFVVFDEMYGDLNKDGIDDYVLIIKRTDSENIVNDEYRGQLDRNRRGIIIALKEEGRYKQVVCNPSCFSSENEDGGVYFAPELSVYITGKGILMIHYSHGRYGYWEHLFRWQNNAFEMIGLTSHSNHGPVTLSINSINFSTRRRQITTNTSDSWEVEDEKLEEAWEDIKNLPLINLNNIEDFDNINLSEYYKEQTSTNIKE